MPNKRVANGDEATINILAVYYLTILCLYQVIKPNMAAFKV